MLSLIVLSYRNPALLRLCLTSIAKAMGGYRDYEVIVVDNDTIESTRAVVTDEFAHTFPAIHLVPLTYNGGYTKGVNEGLRAAHGEYLFPLNYDIVMVPGTAQALMAYLDQHPQVGLVGPRLLNFDDTHQPSCFRFYKPLTILYRRIPFLPWARRQLAWFGMADAPLASIQEADWVSGAAFMTTRTAMEKVGLMDEDLFHYFSDVDWAWRFWENGYTVVYYAVASLYHYHGRTSKGRWGILDPLLNQATRWHINDAIHYFIKHGTRAHRPLNRTAKQPHLAW